MNCPKCSAYNPSDAVKCRNCGAPLRSPNQRPGPQQRPMGPPQQSQSPQRRPAPQRPSGDDKKYVVIGGITVVAFIAVIIMLISLIACNCGGCGKKPDEDYINDIVGGDYDEESPSDTSQAEDFLLDFDEDAPVE